MTNTTKSTYQELKEIDIGDWGIAIVLLSTGIGVLYLVLRQIFQ